MYATYFGFSENPFNLTPDPRFFYSNSGYQEAYANLLYGIQQRKGFLALTGEVGTGKTTILQRLMDHLQPTVPFVFFYNTNLSFDELLTFICEELSLKIDGHGQLEKIQALNKLLLEQLRMGSTAVLIIDEAQNLSDAVFENLRLLSNLETPTEKLLQIVLAGQPELKDKLDRPELRQIKQRIFLHWRLDALEEQEVAAFIQHRLKYVGCKRNNVFAQDAIREIAFYSRGVPRLVNIMCDNALLIAYANDQKVVSTDIVKEVAADLRLRPTNQPAKLKSPISNMQATAKRNGKDPASRRRESPLVKAFSPEPEVIDGSCPAAKPAHSKTDILLQDFLNTLTGALIEALGPMAPLVVREHLAALGTASANVPITSLEKLVESVSAEILNNLLRTRFRERMSHMIGIHNGTSLSSCKYDSPSWSTLA